MTSIFPKVSLLIVISLLCGCSYQNKTTLHVYTWADYFNLDVISDFEEKYNCHISIDYFDSNEAMYAKIKAGGGGYDLITPTSYMTEIMQKQGMINKINIKKIKNYDQLDPNYTYLLRKNTLDYGIPFTVSFTGIGYLKNRVSPEKTWHAFTPEFLTAQQQKQMKNRITLLNDFRETIGAALLALGYNPNTINIDELHEAKELLLKWKSLIAKFENDQYKVGLSSNEFFMSHLYSGDLVQVLLDRPDEIAFFTPKEGFFLSMEQLVIPKGTKNEDLAHQFIDFLLETDNAFKNMQVNHYLCPIIEAYALLKNNNIVISLSPEELKRAFIIEDLGEHTHLYTQIWDEVRSN